MFLDTNWNEKSNLQSFYEHLKIPDVLFVIQGSILYKFYECFFMSLDSYFMKIHKNEFYELFSWLMTHEN